MCLSYIPATPVINKYGGLSNDDSNGNKNITQKVYLTSFVLLHNYFNSLDFYKNGKLSKNQIGRSSVRFKKENEKFTVVRSLSPQNLKCGHFMLLFCRGRQRNVPKCKMHVQSNCFCSLNLFFLRHCRCCRHCLSSLILNVINQLTGNRSLI